MSVSRRTFASLAVAGALATAAPVRAQVPGKLVRIGWLASSRWDTPEVIAIVDAFRSELQRLGWTEGRNLVFEVRLAEGIVDRFPALARELVNSRVDLIFAANGHAAAAAKEVAGVIPIVFATVNDPVAAGLVASLARPGGNATGFATLSSELGGKRLELLKEAFPLASRIGFLPYMFPSASLAKATNTEMHGRAKALGMQLLPATVSRPEDLPAAIAALAHADAWFVGDGVMYFTQRKTIVESIGAQRKPGIYPQVAFAQVGGLMSYSVDLKDQFRRAAGHVDRILRGAKPADLPVEQPVKFEFIINLKTADTLGLKIPQSVLVRADEVIR